MTRHVSDTPFLGHELSTYEHSRTDYGVDVKNSAGKILAAYSGLTTETDALMLGKAWVNGFLTAAAEAVTPKPEPKVRAGQNQHMIRLNDMLREAADLVSDDGENAEYDRALVELSGRLIGLDLSNDETRGTILAMLRAIA